VEGRKRPTFLELGDHHLEIDMKSPTDDLWALHRREMDRFHRGMEGEGDVNLLQLKVEIAKRILDSCHLCERDCGARRSSGERGHCGVLESRVYSDFIHMGEEPPLIPSYTVFFAGCTFECVFCQNYDISTEPTAGVHLEPEVMADRIERVACPSGPTGRSSRALNVNWVGGDPTPNLPYVLQVLERTRCDVPQVWNSNMYLSLDSMELLDGVIDIYLTDLKYGNDTCALRLSNAPRYWEVVTRNHLLAADNAEMIVRHLVMPNHLECCTRPILEWLSESLPNALVNVMAQYRPMHRAKDFPDIAVPLRWEEYIQAREWAEDLGLHLVQ